MYSMVVHYVDYSYLNKIYSVLEENVNIYL